MRNFKLIFFSGGWTIGGTEKEKTIYRTQYYFEQKIHLFGGREKIIQDYKAGKK